MWLYPRRLAGLVCCGTPPKASWRAINEHPSPRRIPTIFGVYCRSVCICGCGINSPLVNHALRFECADPSPTAGRASGLIPVVWAEFNDLHCPLPAFGARRRKVVGHVGGAYRIPVCLIRDADADEFRLLSGFWFRRTRRLTSMVCPDAPAAAKIQKNFRASAFLALCQNHLV